MPVQIDPQTGASFTNPGGNPEGHWADWGAGGVPAGALGSAMPVYTWGASIPDPANPTGIGGVYSLAGPNGGFYLWNQSKQYLGFAPGPGPWGPPGMAEDDETWGRRTRWNPDVPAPPIAGFGENLKERITTLTPGVLRNIGVPTAHQAASVPAWALDTPQSAASFVYNTQPSVWQVHKPQWWESGPLGALLGMIPVLGPIKTIAGGFDALRRGGSVLPIIQGFASLLAGAYGGMGGFGGLNVPSEFGGLNPAEATLSAIAEQGPTSAAGQLLDLSGRGIVSPWSMGLGPLYRAVSGTGDLGGAAAGTLSDRFVSLATDLNPFRLASLGLGGAELVGSLSGRSRPAAAQPAAAAPTAAAGAVAPAAGLDLGTVLAARNYLSRGQGSYFPLPTLSPGLLSAAFGLRAAQTGAPAPLAI